MRARLLGLLVVATVGLAGGPPAMAADPAADSAVDYGGFRSVLGVGEGQTVNGATLAQYEATNAAPGSFVNQLHEYSDVERVGPAFSAANLDEYYKDSSFGSLPGGVGSTESPKAGVTIVRDARYSVPRIYGDNRPDTMWGVGYATAEDRLFLMDVLRRTARGTMSGLLGSSAAAMDSHELGQQDFTDAEYTRQLDGLPQTAGADGAQALQDIRDYIAGINAYISAAQLNPNLLPAEYPALGTMPAPWTEADTAAEATYLIAQFTVSGGGQALDANLRDLAERLHPGQGAALYGDFRRLRDGETPLITHRSFPVDDPGPPTPQGTAMIDPGSIAARDAVVGGAGASSSSARSTLPLWARTLGTVGLHLPHRDSNAVLVTAARSVSGHPLASMGPQVGYYSPEIFLEYEVHGGGIDTSGVAFPGAAPYTLIGHGRDFAWTGTTANGGNEDIFAERLCNPDGSAPTSASTSYLYHGRCVPFEARDQTVSTPVSPLSPGPPGSVTLRALRSVHGPVESYATVGGVPVALTVANATNYHAAQSAVAFMRLNENRVHDYASFADAFTLFTGNENWFYVDDRDVGWLESGWFPVHARGSSRDFPIWGSGDYDWQGFDPASHSYVRMPDSALPRELNPAQSYLVSWNNKEVGNWPSPAGTWSEGPIQHSLTLELPLQDMLRRHAKIDLAQLSQVTIQAATRDPRGQTVLPLALQIIGSDTDPAVAPLLDTLRAWHAGGDQRRDLGNRGYYDSSAAILLMDAWWPRLMRGIFQPALGKPLMDAISAQVNPVDEKPADSGYFNGWFTYANKDLRDLLNPVAARAPAATPSRCRIVARVVRRHGRAVRRHGRVVRRRVRVCPGKARAKHHRKASHRARTAARRRARHHRRPRPRRPSAPTPVPAPSAPAVLDRFSRVYCGNGSLTVCRQVLIQSLLEAAASVRAVQGNDMASWKDPVLCPVPATGSPTCDENVPVTAGAVTTPPFPWQNRGTFHQADEIPGHRPR